MALGYLRNGSAGPQQAEELPGLKLGTAVPLAAINGAGTMVQQQAEILAATRGYLFLIIGLLSHSKQRYLQPLEDS